MYEQLFDDPSPTPDTQPAENTLTVLTGCKAEPDLAKFEAGDRCQFMRIGYFCKDPESTPTHLVFNRTIGLKDSWAKIAKKG